MKINNLVMDSEDKALLLSMKNIAKGFGSVLALKDGRLEVAKGEIHGLIGANGAGKSTLMNILYGIFPPDSGRILFEGREVCFRNISEANRAGIFMIHQELNVAPDLTVAQNIFLGREKGRSFFVDDAGMIRESRELLGNVGLDIDPGKKMSCLSPAEQQLAEIAAVLSRRLRLLILDEPTTALGDENVKKLFDLMRKLRGQGVSTIFISHRLDELLNISDRITVMRDGAFVTCSETSCLTRESLVDAMTGREVKLQAKACSQVPENAPVVLDVCGLSTEAYLHDVSFSLKKGEILGLTGLMGSGRTEVARAVCGLDPVSGGTVKLNGKLVQIRTPKAASELGLGYLSENRNEEGLITGKNIIFNTAVNSLDRYARRGTLDDVSITVDAEKTNHLAGTVCGNFSVPVESLSGGNRQKVMIARALMKDLQILIFDEPTRGIDVGAKRDIYDLIENLAQNGHSILVISSDSEEIRVLCDRVLVMYEGTISGELGAGDITPENIMRLSVGEGSEVR